MIDAETYKLKNGAIHVSSVQVTDHLPLKNSEPYCACAGLDFCRDCLRLEPNEHVANHSPLHTYLLVSFVFMPEEQQRINLEAENVLEQLQQQYRAQQRSISASTAAATKEKDGVSKEEVDTSQEENALGTEKEETVVTQSEEAPSEDVALGEDEAVPQEMAELPQENETEKQGTPTPPIGEEDNKVEIKGNGDTSPEDAETKIADRVPESTPLNKLFVCGRCVEPISWDSDFFRCVGHSCQSMSLHFFFTFHALTSAIESVDYYLCQKCLPERFDANEDDHQWWHSLLCLRKDLIVNTSSDTPSSEVIETNERPKADATDEVANDDKPAVSDSTINVRISNIEEKLSILDNIHSCNSALEQKVERLEAKLDNVMAALETLLGNLPGKSVA